MKLKTNKPAAAGGFLEESFDRPPVKAVKKTKKQNGSASKVVAPTTAAVPPTTNGTKPNKKKKKKKSSDSNGGTTAAAADNHKVGLSKLKNIDPEFYKFLEQNDKKLLNFNADNEFGDSDDDEDDEAAAADEKEMVDDDDDDDIEPVHKPSADFDVASDESDFEDPDAADDDADKEDMAADDAKYSKGGTRLITLKLLKQWQTDLSADKVHVDTIKNVIAAVNSALLSISGDHVSGMAYKVEGAAVFNGVLQLCVLHLHPAIKRFLGLAAKTSKKPHKCKKWTKIRSSLKDYLIDLTKLLEHVSSANILVVLLKHLHQISPMIASFSALIKPILKRLVTLWSTADETVRVLAFLSILKITRGQQTSLLNTILKAMYLSYIRNSKFVSPGTLPGINFMRRSLAEMFALDLNVSYQHVFLYIRQLAIHLRNALTLKKKDSFQAVYNWQFINSLRLWVELLSATAGKSQLQPLIFPLVSIVTGTIKLIPTAQFFPLRFHCIQILVQLARETRTFVPVMPFILEVLHSNTFQKKHSSVSMKPLSFTCILRLNKAQMLENGFRDEVVENIFGLTLEYMAHESFTLSYPDLAVPAVVNLKQYLKRCRNSNHSRKLKQLVDKLEESSRLVEKERERVTFGLRDNALIAAWETTLQNRGTPLLTYYTNWVRTHFNKKKRQATDSDKISDYNLPMINRGSKDGRRKNDGDDDGPVDLFPSDDEDDDVQLGLMEEKPPAAKKAKVAKKVPRADDDDDDDFHDDGVDIVKDLDLDDW